MQQNQNHPQAGTSSDQNHVQPNPNTLFYPPIQQGHLPSVPINGSNDLLSLFNLSSMYDWYVKPYQKPVDLNNPAISSQTTGLNGDLKGKGKADIPSLGAPSPAQPDNLAPKRIKMEKSYGHFVADVGGRNSIKKDHQLENWIKDPNFQESQVQDFLKPFSNEVLSRSFTLKPGILDGFDSSIWVAEEGGPKRKKKKRKQGEMMAGSVGMNATGSQQGAIPQHQVHLPSQQLNSTNQQQVQYPTSIMMANQQSVSSTTPVTKNARLGIKPSRNVLNEPNQLVNNRRISHPQSSNLPQPLDYPHSHSNNDVFYGHEDHRKKKRTKMNNTSSHSNNPASNNPNTPSGSASGSSNHRLALQS